MQWLIKSRKCLKPQFKNGEDILIDAETKEMVRAAVEKLPEKLKKCTNFKRVC